ncbi:Uma2 family endonuclease [candidate division KSB1 bacterium]|nr:Uma2 family endonuclease [candidate division KSB1 bacterium]
MSTQPQRSFLTPEEYLEIERKAEFKSEYFNGEMFAMAGAKRPHNRIVSSVIRVIDTQLLERDCNIYPSDMRVKIEKINKYTYPDVVVTCGKEILEDDQIDTLLNPVLIVEILSASTEAYDRGEKFQHYQFIPSLVEYILITQNAIRVEQYVRQSDRTWLYSEYQSLDDVIKLESIGCELALKEVYAKVPNALAQK